MQFGKRQRQRNRIRWSGTACDAKVSIDSESLEFRQLLSAEPLLAGRGQDMLLLVNPADENSIRIANAYQEMRHIPDRNIVFLEAPGEDGFGYLTLQQEEFWQPYITTLYGILQQRGLQNQIDFIGDLGHVHSFSHTGGTQSLSYAMTQLRQYANGMTPQEGISVTSGLGLNANDPDLFNVIHSTDVHNIPYGAETLQHRYYMGGMIGVTSRLGNSADQIIAGLKRSVAADGTHPQGTIYLEENSDIRSNIREPQWPEAKQELASRGIRVV